MHRFNIEKLETNRELETQRLEIQRVEIMKMKAQQEAYFEGKRLEVVAQQALENQECPFKLRFWRDRQVCPPRVALAGSTGRDLYALIW